MADREKVFDALRNCVTEPKCKDCPWEDCEKIGCKRTKVPVTLLLDTLNLLKDQQETIASLQGTICKLNAALAEQPVDKELHLDDLDMLVKMIAIKAKAEGRFFSPYEVGLALVQHGQHDERFKWGEVIKYSPSEVEQILNEVIE